MSESTNDGRSVSEAPAEAGDSRFFWFWNGVLCVIFAAFFLLMRPTPNRISYNGMHLAILVLIAARMILAGYRREAATNGFFIFYLLLAMASSAWIPALLQEIWSVKCRMGITWFIDTRLDSISLVDLLKPE